MAGRPVVSMCRLPSLQGENSPSLGTRWRYSFLLRQPMGLRLLFVLLILVRQGQGRQLRDRELSFDPLTADHEWNDLGLTADNGTPAAAASLAAVAAAAAQAAEFSRRSTLSHFAPSLTPVLRTLHRIFPSNISGTYKGTWEVLENQTSLPFPDLKRRSGNIIFQIRASSTARHEIHFLQGEVVLRDGLYISDGDVHMKLEGVYVRNWGELRMLLSSALDPELDWEEAVAPGNAYQMGLADPVAARLRTFEQGSLGDMSRKCRVRMVAHVSPTEWDWKTTFADGVREHVPSEIQGLLESPWDSVAASERAQERRHLLDQVERELKKQAELETSLTGPALLRGESSSQDNKEAPDEGLGASGGASVGGSVGAASTSGEVRKGGEVGEASEAEGQILAATQLGGGEHPLGDEEAVVSLSPTLLGEEESRSEGGDRGPVSNGEYLDRRRALIRSLNVNEDEEEGEHSPCFATLRINATAVDLDAFYNKAVNYTLLVTFVSFLQVLFIIRQMEHSNTQSGAAKVSMLMVGQQAIMDAYLCLLHLTAGIVVESLFNAFATAAFFKFVIFSIFEMRYLLAIWKARRPSSTADSWDVMRRELSVLYSRFYGFLLGGILLLYKFNSVLRYLLLVFYSFWIPQIVTSVIRDSRKPLHLYYIIGMTLTRLAVPLYIFGCPRNFMRIEPNYHWCAALVAFMGFQVTILLLQHFFGPRCFIPRQFLPEKYSYFRRLDWTRFRESSSPREDGAVTDCVICMAPVCSTQPSTENMVTPCDHVFHARCLQRWMDIKMECPTCRRALPPL